ncbi:hypothetical protein ACWDUG_06780, partial [Streptomyces cellulosae]
PRRRLRRRRRCRQRSEVRPDRLQDGLLAHGTVAVGGEIRSREALDAVRRAGLVFGGRPPGLPGPPSLSPAPLVLLPPLTAGSPARFAVFDVPDRVALVREGASTCVATVVGGRLVHRRR